jgi:hypothetical protein
LICHDRMCGKHCSRDVMGLLSEHRCFLSHNIEGIASNKEHKLRTCSRFESFRTLSPWQEGALKYADVLAFGSCICTIGPVMSGSSEKYFAHSLKDVSRSRLPCETMSGLRFDANDQ